MRTIIFDWKQTLYSPDEKKLIDGAIEILAFAKDKGLYIAVVGKGGDDMYDEVERLDVKPYFNHTAFREGDKDPGLFADVVAVNGPGETVFVGDRVRSELQVGNSLGCQTVWVKQGKFADELPENDTQKPTYTVASLAEAKHLLETLL